MDGLSHTVCTGIVFEILEYVEKETAERQDAAENENFAATTENSEVDNTGLKKYDQECDCEENVLSKFAADILEEAKKILIYEKVLEVSTDDPFEMGDTEEVVCTEILDKNGEEVEKNETLATDDLNAHSWYDLFKDAYGSWGRDANKTVEATLFEPAGLEPSEIVPTNQEMDDGRQEAIDQEGFFNSDHNTEEMDTYEEASDDPDKYLKFEEVYKVFLEDLDLDINCKEGLVENTEEGVSGSKISEDIVNKPVDEHEEYDGDNPERVQIKKSKVECGRSPRLSWRSFLHLGSVVKTDLERIKIVLRRSARLDVKRKMMEQEKEDAVGKKSQKN